MRLRLAGLAIALVLAGCSTSTDTASSTSSTAVEDALPFASTTTSRPREVTTPPQTEPATTAPPPPVTQGFVSPAPAAAAPARANCDSSYPDTCIPPPPPDLDCGDISARRFKVRPPDPHGFDSDGDGIGCESG